MSKRASEKRAKDAWLTSLASYVKLRGEREQENDLFFAFGATQSCSSSRKPNSTLMTRSCFLSADSFLVQ